MRVGRDFMSTGRSIQPHLYTNVFMHMYSQLTQCLGTKLGVDTGNRNRKSV